MSCHLALLFHQLFYILVWFFFITWLGWLGFSIKFAAVFTHNFRPQLNSGFFSWPFSPERPRVTWLRSFFQTRVCFPSCHMSHANNTDVAWLENSTDFSSLALISWIQQSPQHASFGRGRGGASHPVGADWDWSQLNVLGLCHNSSYFCALGILHLWARLYIYPD